MGPKKGSKMTPKSTQVAQKRGQKWVHFWRARNPILDVLVGDLGSKMAQKWVHFGPKKWSKKGQKVSFLAVLVPYFDPFFGEGGTARPIKLPKTGQKVDPRVHVWDPKIPLF